MSCVAGLANVSLDLVTKMFPRPARTHCHLPGALFLMPKINDILIGYFFLFTNSDS